MPNPNPTSARALVRYRVTKAQVPTDKTLAVTPAGAHAMEEFELDPPTHSVAEVEKRWRDANAEADREFVDADLLPVEATEALEEPVLANQTIPAPGTPTDQQIIRERAAGREEGSTVTPEEDLPKATIKPVKGAAKSDDESPVSDTNADEAIATIGNMRSRERLQHVIDNDKRVTVKDAAKKRLTALGDTAK